MNRRDLLRRGFVFAAASTLPAILPFGLAAQTHRLATRFNRPRPQTNQLDMHTFELLKGEYFQVVRDGSSLDPYLMLVEVKELPTAKTGRKCQAFSLRLYGGASDMMPQGLYKLRNAHLGEIRMFIVPEEKDTRDYFATFNRLSK